ncbi:NAD-dependent epimerase/dehydratase family protein [Paenarthrobacter sp. NyZ202]|uniref:NAD-dependent epimerase/dehydratase family protein n=1 Tax=Paenarthrobacter sp. NyZ202 TaxID=3402689 RepID=UPI003CFA2B13
MLKQKTVAVTGSSGKLGRAVVAELLEAGWKVHGFDIVPPKERTASFTRIDLGDLGQVVEAFTSIDELHDGVDAIVHLAAIPGATMAANTATFVNNITASYNVFTAAKIADVRNIVWASSETLLGYPFIDTRPPYVPMDEEYAAQGNVAYSLEKVLEEELARQLTRRDDQLKMIGLRFSYIQGPEDYPNFLEQGKNPADRKWNMWGYIDVRDASRAVLLALELDKTGFEAINIAAADTIMQQPTRDLMQEYFPEVPFRESIEGTSGLTDIRKASRVLGWEPRHSWRDED